MLLNAALEPGSASARKGTLKGLVLCSGLRTGHRTKAVSREASEAMRSPSA